MRRPGRSGIRPPIGRPEGSPGTRSAAVMATRAGTAQPTGEAVALSMTVPNPNPWTGVVSAGTMCPPLGSLARSCCRISVRRADRVPQGSRDEWVKWPTRAPRRRRQGSAVNTVEANAGSCQISCRPLAVRKSARLLSRFGGPRASDIREAGTPRDRAGRGKDETECDPVTFRPAGRATSSPSPGWGPSRVVDEDPRARRAVAAGAGRGPVAPCLRPLTHRSVVPPTGGPHRLLRPLAGPGTQRVEYRQQRPGTPLHLRPDA